MDNKKKNPNVPNLRFRFDDDWKSDIFMNLVDRRSDKLNPVQLMNKDFKCIELDSLSQETGELLATYLAVEQRSIKNLFYKNDILYGKLRPYLRKYYKANFDGCCSSEIWVLNSKFINHDFLYHYIQTNNFNTLANISTGSKMPRADWNIISESELSYPSMEEMKKIGEFLNHIEEKIKIQSKIIEDLKVVKEQISNQLFKLEMIYNSSYTLNDFLVEGDKTPVQTNKYRKITIKLNKQGIIFSETNREMADTRPFYKRYENELIIGKQNYFNGSIALITKEFDSCICSNAIMSFKINNINKDFLYYQISNNNYLNSQAYKANGTGQKELSEREFLKFKVWVPTNNVQKEIVKCFKSLELKITNEISLLSNYTLMKKYLLENMFI